MPLPPLVDTHAHLQFDHFDADRDDVIARARAAGTAQIVCVGTDVKTSRQAVTLAAQLEGIGATAGVQPGCVPDTGDAQWAEIEALADNERVLAVGETGLDNSYDWSPPGPQRAMFEKQIALALRVRKPIVIHCRKAADTVIEMLEAERGRLLGVQHCFSENVDYARRILDLGFYISFTGIITRQGYKQLKAAARYVPADRLLIETDCPYLPPVGAPERRNEPAFLPLTLHALATIRATDPEALAQQTTDNAHRLFRIPG